ncbi:11823_t:CDS:2 [Funneliformis caledonium]|uniref:11823_t:CDS:1 n=1 Tax=Funneliformis caledonium TaxID=1117310 RepID=A0A9N9FL13_9GLOM|nr:11823_t:CDS:2 [Funneliformis caledonium]
MEKPPVLINDRAVLNIVNDHRKYSPLNDQDLREILQLFLYGLGSETEDPSMESLAGLMAELKSRIDNTPINLLSIEATKSIYIYLYLLTGV